MDKFEKAECELAEFIDREVYLPVREELKGCGGTYSLGLRKERLKGKIMQVMNKLRSEMKNE